MRLLLSAVLLLAALSGCASRSASKVDWAARVGSYTFDDAVRELGPPDRDATLSDGTRVVQWAPEAGRSSVSFGMGGGSWGSGGGVGVGQSVGVPVGGKAGLRMTFAPDGRLAGIPGP